MTTLLHPLFVESVTFAGQVSEQLLAAMVTLKLQLAELFEASVAVQVTWVVPVGKLEPEGGLQETTMLSGVVQLSVADGVV